MRNERIDVARLRTDLYGYDRVPLDANGVYKDFTIFARWSDEILYRTTVTVVKSRGVGGKPRIYLDCPECGKMLPAGRLQQHIGTGTCK